MPTTRELLDLGIAALALDIPADRRPRLIEFLDALTALGRRLSVTSARSQEDRVETILLDSLVLTRWVNGPGRLCDVGAGFGIPAIPVAIAERDVRLTLVERSAKRCVHLRSFLRQFKLDGEVVEADASALSPIDADWFSARAFASPQAWRAIATRIAPQRATVLTLHAGKDLPGERYVLPFSNRHRSVEMWRHPA